MCEEMEEEYEWVKGSAGRYWLAVTGAFGRASPTPISISAIHLRGKATYMVRANGFEICPYRTIGEAKAQAEALLLGEET